MTAVKSASPSAESLPPMSGHFRRQVNAWAKALSDTWFALQITHFGGKYSIERMLALEEYTRNTSLLRVLLVIVATPLPTIVIVLCQESIPLQNPSEGWSVNYGFWIRMGILGIGESYATLVQTGCLLDGVSLSVKKMLILCICVAGGNTAASMLVANHWVFPIPFTNFTISPVLFVLFIGTFRVLAGSERCRQILSQREQLYQVGKYLSVQMVMVFIYPAYQILIEAASHAKFELPADMIPEQVIFTVDFFHAFYLAMCMKNISSIITVVAIMVADFIETCIDIQELNHRIRSIHKRLDLVLGTKMEAQNLIAGVRMCSRSENLPSHIRVRSCISHKISSEGEIFLKSMDGPSKMDQ